MRASTALVVVCAFAALSGLFVFLGVQKSEFFTNSEVEVYNRWRAEFNKLTMTPSESGFRMRILIEKAKQIRDWNAQYEKHVAEKGLPPLTGPMFDLKEWSDLTDEEFNKRYLGLKSDNLEHLEVEQSLGYELPASNAGLGALPFDFKVRSQGGCGSCWAFSTVATLERHYFLRKGVQIDLSQQLLVDCSRTNGCGGGNVVETYRWVQANGIQNAASYPYLAVNGICKRQADKAIWFDNTYAPREVAFSPLAALNAAYQQISAGLQVHCSGKFSSLSNTKDVYDAAWSRDESQLESNHAVTLANAFREPDGRIRVLIQNSWGTGWGWAGLKRVYPFSDKILWGLPSSITYTTNVAV